MSVFPSREERPRRALGLLSSARAPLLPGAAGLGLERMSAGRQQTSKAQVPGMTTATAVPAQASPSLPHVGTRPPGAAPAGGVRTRLTTEGEKAQGHRRPRDRGEGSASRSRNTLGLSSSVSTPHVLPPRGSGSLTTASKPEKGHNPSFPGSSAAPGHQGAEGGCASGRAVPGPEVPADASWGHARGRRPALCPRR